ncbi:MAG: efflux RND transporter periplasmic adaptor subunit [Bacteroidales bacterium]|nr:efflux RND transporter periplasmic adaptor subunit [Bacteroidales bacterium]
MKTTKIMITSIVILALLFWGAIKLTNNKQAIQDEAIYASQKITEIPVKVVSPYMGSMNLQVSSTGIISPFEALTVVSETQGKVEKIYKQVGDPVRKGEVMVEIDDETIVASVLVAEANFEQLSKDIERYRRLEEGNAIAKHDLEQAEIGLKKAQADLINARKALRDTKIVAPISGIVNKKMIENGQFVSGGLPVYEIVNTSKLKIWVKIAEKDIFKIFKGQEATIRIPVLPGEEFPGKVNAIGEMADKAMKFDVEVSMTNPGARHIKAGLYAEVAFPVEASQSMIVDKVAITGSMIEPSVFVVEGNKAVKRGIVIGGSNDKYVEVISGLTAEDKVVVSGQLNLQDGNAVKIIE